MFVHLPTRIFWTCQRTKIWFKEVGVVVPSETCNEKNPSCLGYIGDYTTQLNGDYNKLF